MEPTLQNVDTYKGLRTRLRVMQAALIYRPPAGPFEYTNRALQIVAVQEELSRYPESWATLYDRAAVAAEEAQGVSSPQ